MKSVESSEPSTPLVSTDSLSSPLRRKRKKGVAGYAFVSGYFVLLILFGVAPAIYAITLAFTASGGHFTGLTNFIKTGEDFRFLPAFENVGKYLFIWLASLVVIVLGLALMLHSIARRVSAAFRFIFYLPGALAGAASVLVWLFMLDPTVSPWRLFLGIFGFKNLGQTILPGHLPLIFAIIAFWAGQLDGAGAIQTALRIKLPLIKKWIVFMLILAFAAGTQLFVEPQLVGEASLGLISPTWSPNELAYYFAFQDNNFNYAAAISVDLLVIGLLCAAVLVFRTKLFEVE
jgi:multiple sugar transport system permease protein